MAHELWPSDGAPFLSVEEILDRWRAAFAYVDADAAAGREHMDAVIAHLQRMAGQSQHFSADDVRRARRNRDHAVQVRLADAARPGDAYLETVIEPESQIVFDYADGHHEDAAAPLVARAASALGYDVELV